MITEEQIKAAEAKFGELIRNENARIEAMKKDFADRFHDASGANMHLELAYTQDLEAAKQFKEEVQAQFPDHDIVMNPLSLSISCHIGPGSLAIACSHKIGMPV